MKALFFIVPGDLFDGAHEDVSHDAHAQEAVDEGEEVDGSSELPGPGVL